MADVDQVRAFLAGFQAGAEYPDDSGDGDSMYQHYRDWRDAQVSMLVEAFVEGR